MVGDYGLWGATYSSMHCRNIIGGAACTMGKHTLMMNITGTTGDKTFEYIATQHIHTHDGHATNTEIIFFINDVFL